MKLPLYFKAMLAALCSLLFPFQNDENSLTLGVMLIFSQSNEMRARGLLDNVTDTDLAEMWGQSAFVVQKVYQGMMEEQRKTTTQLQLRRLMEVRNVKGILGTVLAVWNGHCYIMERLCKWNK